MVAISRRRWPRLVDSSYLEKFTCSQRSTYLYENCPLIFAQLQQQEQDPTNLYIANLPPHYNEQALESVLQKYGMVVSTRILRNADGQSRGVGFARMDSKVALFSSVKIN